MKYKIKNLEWNQISATHWVAYTAISSYEICFDKNEYAVKNTPDADDYQYSLGWFDEIEKAKQFAQSHFSAEASKVVNLLIIP